MANYFNTGISEVPMLADEDLTQYQYRMVMAASTNGYVQLFDILPTAASPRHPVGVLVNSPSLGQEASIKVIGFTKAFAQVSTGCDLKNGTLLSASDDGLFLAASQDESDPIFGIWFGPDCTSGSIYGNVLLNMFPASGYQYLNTVN